MASIFFLSNKTFFFIKLRPVYFLEAWCYCTLHGLRNLGKPKHCSAVMSPALWRSGLEPVQSPRHAWLHKGCWKCMLITIMTPCGVAKTTLWNRPIKGRAASCLHKWEMPLEKSFFLDFLLISLWLRKSLKSVLMSKCRNSRSLSFFVCEMGNKDTQSIGWTWDMH